MTAYTADFYFKFPGSAKLLREYGRFGFRQEEYNSPWFLDTSPAGDVIIADTDNNRIQVLDANSQLTLSFPYGEKGQNWGELKFPRSVKYSPFLNTHLLIVDSGNSRLVFVKIRPDAFVQQYHVIGQTFLRQPTDAALDAARNVLYVTDTTENCVVILDPNGEYIGRFRNGPVPLKNPTGITQDREGRVYVSDTGNHCIQVFEPSGQYIQRFGEFGTGVGQFNTPKGICIDPKGRIFIADQLNDRVMMYSEDLRMVSEVVKDIPHPKGVAAQDQLYVTTSDRYNVLKVYNV